MKLKNCSECNEPPRIQSTEIGMVFRLICNCCGKHTKDILSPTSSIGDIFPDDETFCQLSKEWNNSN